VPSAPGEKVRLFSFDLFCKNGIFKFYLFIAKLLENN
jgi:hypothetical protein